MTVAKKVFFFLARFPAADEHDELYHLLQWEQCLQTRPVSHICWSGSLCYWYVSLHSDRYRVTKKNHIITILKDDFWWNCIGPICVLQMQPIATSLRKCNCYSPSPKWSAYVLDTFLKETHPLCIVAKTPLGGNIVVLFRENFHILYVIYMIFVRQLFYKK